MSARRFCPLSGGECRSDCMWYLASGHCAVAVIAMRLDALIEGVPVIRLFEEEV